MDEELPVIPLTPKALRLAKLFNRRSTTPWSVKEIRAYKVVAQTSLAILEDELELIERYYASERKKGDKGIHRRDLQTLLNNWNGEVDRARAWHVGQVRRKDWRYLRELGTATDEDYKQAGGLAKQEIEKLRAHLDKPVHEVIQNTNATVEKTQ